MKVKHTSFCDASGCGASTRRLLISTAAQPFSECETLLLYPAGVKRGTTAQDSSKHYEVCHEHSLLTGRISDRAELGISQFVMLFPQDCCVAAGLDSDRAAPSESGASTHAHGQDQVFSLAETARLFHRDNKGSTAATIGNSTTFGGSDAGTGAAPPALFMWISVLNSIRGAF